MARRLGASCYCKNRCVGVGRHAWLSLLRESWRGWATLLLECTSVYDDEWPGASVLLLQELGAAGLGATPVSALLRGSTAWLKCTPAGVHSGGAQRRTSHEMSRRSVIYNTRKHATVLYCTAACHGPPLLEARPEPLAIWVGQFYSRLSRHGGSDWTNSVHRGGKAPAFKPPLPQRRQCTYSSADSARPAAQQCPYNSADGARPAAPAVHVQ